MSLGPVSISPRRLKHLLDAANRDFLTGVYNLRAFRREFAQLVPRFRRGQAGPFGLVLIDIQKFGAINERFGHDRANGVLKEFAGQLSGRLKVGVDFIARFGGDEFVAIVKVKDRQQLHGVLERLRQVYIVEIDGRPLKLDAYAVGALARRRGDVDFLEGRVHLLLRSAKKLANRSTGKV